MEDDEAREARATKYWKKILLYLVIIEVLAFVLYFVSMNLLDFVFGYRMSGWWDGLCFLGSMGIGFLVWMLIILLVHGKSNRGGPK